MIRIFFRFLLILIAAPLLNACEHSAPSRSADPEATDTLRFDVHAPFSSLCPADSDTAGGIFVFPLLFDYLGFNNTVEGTFSLGLAKSSEYDPAAFTWDILLRDDAFFSDGQKVVAKDVRFSIDTVVARLKPEIYVNIDRMETPTPHRLRIVLKKNDPSFFLNISSMEILPHYIPLEHQKVHPIGSGPYRFLDALEGNTVLTLERVEDFYKGTPHIKRIRFRYIPNTETSWTRLIAGETDITYWISPSNYALMRYIQNRYQISTTPSPYTWVIAYNANDPLFADPQVRHAVSYCIDRDYIVRELLAGYGDVVLRPFGTDSPYGRHSQQENRYDPERGRQLLEAAGWQRNETDGMWYKNGHPFEFTLLYPNENRTEKCVADYLRLSLYEMGIRVILQPVPFSALSGAYISNSEYQAVLITFKKVQHFSSRLVNDWLPKESGSVYMGNFRSPRLTAQLKRLAACNDQPCEISVCREIEDLLVELQPITPLYSKREIVLVSSRIELPFEFYPNYTAIHQLYKAEIKPEE